MNGSIECAFIGRVASDTVELKTSQAGKPWTAFNAGVGQGDDVQWLRISVFGDTAEHLAGTLKKGDRIYVEGTMKLNTWIGKSGEQRSGLSVAAWKAEKLGQIGRSRPARPRAPLEREHTPSRPENGSAAWQRPDYGGDPIPFAPEVRG